MTMLSVNFTSPAMRHKCQRVFWWASCTSTRHAGSFGCLMTSLILITIGQWQRALCMVAVLQSSQPNQQRNNAIKQNKICAEYRDMLPRPRLDLSGTPGLRPIGLSPGSWQTSLGHRAHYDVTVMKHQNAAKNIAFEKCNRICILDWKCFHSTQYDIFQCNKVSCSLTSYDF